MDYIEYQLSVINGENQYKKIDTIRYFSKGEFEFYTSSIKKLNLYQKQNSLFDIVKLNYEDFKRKIKFYIAKEDFKTDDNVDIYIDLNRHILNCLFAIRTYQDHVETRLKREFGDESDEYSLFKNLTSRCYDENFSYRFLTKLRNYSQHCGLPTGSIIFSENKNGKRIEISLSRNDLLEKYDSWSQKVKPDLVNQAEYFDIIPLLNDVIHNQENINNDIDKVLIQNFKNEGFRLLQLIHETQIKGNGIPTILMASGPEKNPNVQMYWFPYKTISRITGVEITFDKNK
ncbi:hypothetical protein [Salegentibacter sp. Hel_I_6]|uniref:hypothetical protein n=1 Tax=Salegentibacter sp. Hel_I_6 TaxID=1250278 RepID=UPI00056823B8|nr:hypothetical protein [Salegentibacter sp. Hel_I_6]